MLNNILRTRLKIVAGYAGTRQVTIAIERGEVHGMCGMSWSSLVVQQPDWVTRGFVKVLVQEFGARPCRDEQVGRAKVD